MLTYSYTNIFAGTNEWWHNISFNWETRFSCFLPKPLTAICRASLNTLALLSGLGIWLVFSTKDPLDPGTFHPYNPSFHIEVPDRCPWPHLQTALIPQHERVFLHSRHLSTPDWAGLSLIGPEVWTESIVRASLTCSSSESPWPYHSLSHTHIHHSWACVRLSLSLPSSLDHGQPSRWRLPESIPSFGHTASFSKRVPTSTTGQRRP